jgi:peptidyl-prolyl cis-trans isomerase D
MMSSLRGSVWGWIGLGFLALGALALVLIDLGQGGSGPGGRGESGTVLATVGDDSVTEPEFVRRLNRALDQQREGDPSLTISDFIRGGGADLVLSQMVAASALEQFGARHGLIVSERMIDGEIASIPAAQVNGQFSEERFRRLLEQQRITEAEVRDGIRSDLMRRQLLAPVALGAHVPRGMAEPFARLLLEVREGQLLAVPFEAMPDPGAPTDAQLEAFWRENRRVWTVPERRSFRFALIEPEGIAETVKVTPEEVEAFYKANIGQFGGEELRDMRQVVLPSQAEAQRFVDEVRGGRAFPEAASARGFTGEDTALGQRTRESLADDTSDGVAAAAFRTPAGQVTNPIQGPLGVHVVEVISIRPAAPRPLATVSAEIEKRLVDERVQARLAETINDAEDRIDAGESFGAVAEGLGLSIDEVPPVTTDGLRLTDDFRLEPAASPLVDRVFAIDPADGPQVVDVGGGRFAMLEIREVIAPTVIPLEQVRDRIVVGWQADQRRRAADAMASEIAAAATDDDALRQAATQRRLPPPQRFAVRRLELTQAAQQGQTIPPPVLRLLNTPEGQARAVEAPQAGAAFVVRTLRVTPGNLDEAPELGDAVRQSLTREAAAEMAEFYVRAVEREVGTATRPEAFEAVKRRLAGVPQDE